MASTGAPLGAGFWRVWTASVLSNLADGALKIAVPLVGIRYTESPALIAGLAVTLTLPWLVFSLPVGALIDRWDRRRVMLAANVARAALLIALTGAVAADVASIWLLYAVTFGIGCAEVFYDTSAQSILPQLVDRRALPRANGRLHAAELSANQFIGPPLGGVLIAAGAVLAFLSPAALWAIAVGVLMLVRGNFRAEQAERVSLVRDIGEGLRHLWGQVVLRTMAAVTGVFNFASNAVFAVFVLYAVGPDSALGLSEPGFGLLIAVIAVGSLIGALLADRIERVLGRARALAAAIVSGAVMLAIPAITTNIAVIAVVFGVGGITIAVLNVIMISLRQRIVPDRLLGRVNSGYRLLAWGTMPLGAAAGGLLAQWLGLPAVMLMAGALVLCLLLALVIITDARMDAAEREAGGGN